jgi:hypothetical protein
LDLFPFKVTFEFIFSRTRQTVKNGTAKKRLSAPLISLRRAATRKMFGKALDYIG